MPRLHESTTMTTQPIQIKEPGELIKKLALVNDWHYGLLSRAMAVIGPNKSEKEVLLALQEAADNINLAGVRGGGADHPDNQALKLKGAKVFGYRSVADFDEACKRPFPGYHRGKYPLSVNVQSEPPASCQSCDLKVGDVVTFTNDYGLKFPHKVVTGFAPEAEYGRYVYYDSDAWWFPVRPESLTLEHETEYHVWCDDDCQNKTSSLEEAKKWRDWFVADGRTSWIVDSDGNYITDGEVDPAQTTVVVAAAEGQLLDWLVSKAIGEFKPTPVPSYSTDPAIGGALILGAPIEIRHRPTPWSDVEATWCDGTRINQFGPNPLIAGLRAYVSGRLGVQVNVLNHVLAQLSPRYQPEQDAGDGETADAPVP